MSTTLEPEPTAAGKFVTFLKSVDRWGLALGVALQLGVLVSMGVIRVMILIRGETYLVRVQPVDPRDWLRGDYVILSYEFSRLQRDGRTDFNVDQQFMFPEKLRDVPIYVTLAREPDGRHWQAVRFSREHPKEGPFLRGKMNQFGMLEFGIESYFVQEGKGHQYEDAMRSRQLSAEITITPEGTAAVRKLHIGGN